jgi:hypothetical protein
LITAKIKATLVLSGNNFEEDSALVYAVIATSTFDMTAYSFVRQFEETRNGRDVMLALKLQFGGKAYVVSRSKDANSIIRTAQFSGPTRQYMHDQHVTRFNDSYNELTLIGEPIQEHVKVQLFCDSLQVEIFKMQVQLAPAMARNFTKATGMLKSMRNMLVSNKAKAGVEHYVAELGITQKRNGGGRGGGGGGHPGNKRKKKGGGGAGGARGGLQLQGYSDKEWHDLPAATKAKVNMGCAAEKAAKRAASAASLSVKTADADKDKEAEKGGIKFGKGAHA